jgi:class 3 adenylate cyclase
MVEARVERRLAAIGSLNNTTIVLCDRGIDDLATECAADVAGYSRLMGSDEVGTLAALKAGDGMLVEFASAVDALACAVTVQGKMAERDPGTRHEITFRVGINVALQLL